MTPAAHSGSAIFVELGLALFLKGGSRGLEERTLTVRMGREPSTRWSRKCFRSSVTVEVKLFHGGLGSDTKLFYLQPFPHKITNMKANSHC